MSDVVASQLDARRPAGGGHMQLDDRGARLARGVPRIADQFGDLAPRDPAGEQQLLGAAARGRLAVELQLLEHHRRRGRGSRDVEHTCSHIVRTCIGRFGHAL
jgi:hypothetical protein